MKKKVLVFLGNHFDPDSRVLKETKSLADSGYEVTVRCYWESGLPKEELKHGVTIKRVLHTSRKYRKSVVDKILLLFLFFFKAIRSSKDYDVIHCHDLLTLPIGVMAKWINRTQQKVIYDSHEYQTEQAGKPKWLKPFLKITEGFFIKYVDYVITVSDSIAEEYKRLYKIKKPSVILNCPPYVTLDKQDYFRDKFNLSKDTIIYLYQGGFSPNRGIEAIIEAFKRIKDPKKVVVFMGYGVLEKEIQLACEKSQNIFLHEAVSQEELPDYTGAADVGILTYMNTCLNHYYCSPNKFFEYTMSGLPIIVSNLFELSRLVTKYDNGFILAENTAEVLYKAIENMTREDIERKKKNTPEIKKEFCWENQEKLLLGIYKGIAVC